MTCPMPAGYARITGFLTPTELGLTSNYITHLRIQDPDAGRDLQVPGAYARYGDPYTEALLVSRLPVMEKALGLKLFPTYSYLRVYQMGMSLPAHTDRAACEYSVSIHISSVTKWALKMGSAELICLPGDAVVYKGCEVEHSRGKLSAGEYTQVFLHYVDANGPHRKEALDRRLSLGRPKSQRAGK